MFLTCGTVFLTLLVNAVSRKMLMRSMGLQDNGAESNLLDHAGLLTLLFFLTRLLFRSYLPHTLFCVVLHHVTVRSKERLCALKEGPAAPRVDWAAVEAPLLDIKEQPPSSITIRDNEGRRKRVRALIEQRLLDVLKADFDDQYNKGILNYYCVCELARGG
jgi:hypothetical protein